MLPRVIVACVAAISLGLSGCGSGSTPPPSPPSPPSPATCTLAQSGGSEISIVGPNTKCCGSLKAVVDFGLKECGVTLSQVFKTLESSGEQSKAAFAKMCPKYAQDAQAAMKTLVPEAESDCAGAEMTGLTVTGFKYDLAKSVHATKTAEPPQSSLLDAGMTCTLAQSGGSEISIDGPNTKCCGSLKAVTDYGFKACGVTLSQVFKTLESSGVDAKNGLIKLCPTYAQDMQVAMTKYIPEVESDCAAAEMTGFKVMGFKFDDVAMLHMIKTVEPPKSSLLDSSETHERPRRPLRHSLSLSAR